MRVLLLALAATTAMVGCSSVSSQFAARDSSAEAGQVAVRLLEQDGDIFKFYVSNKSDKHMTLLRDKVMLVVDGNAHPREPGGLQSTYDLPPGGGHDVNVKYDLSPLENARNFEVSFQGAVLQNGEPVEAPAIAFERRQPVQ